MKRIAVIGMKRIVVFGHAHATVEVHVPFFFSFRERLSLRASCSTVYCILYTFLNPRKTHLENKTKKVLRPINNPMAYQYASMYSR